MPRYVDIDNIKLMSDFKDTDGDLLVPLKVVRQQILQAEAKVGNNHKIKDVPMLCIYCDHFEVDGSCLIYHEMVPWYDGCDKFE